MRKTDILTVTGGNAQIYVSFGSAPGADGQTLTLLGVDFETDSAIDFTFNTFKYGPTTEDAARNLANMCRASYLFVGWSISVYESAGNWLVRLIKDDAGNLDDFTNDASGLSPTPSLSDVNGIDEVRSTDRFWYQFYEGVNPVSEQKFAAFDENGRVRVNAEPLARNILGITDPYLLWTSSVRDLQASRNIYLRFGTYSQGEDCQYSLNESYETPEITLVNSLFQWDHVTRFLNYTPNYNMPVKWMTARPMERYVCANSYEWCAIWLQRSALFPNGFYKVIYNYYDSDDTLLNTKTELLSNYPDGVYHISIGAANSVHPSGAIAPSAYYTVHVEVQGDDSGYTQYSETQTLTLNTCNCWAAEVYYLEDAGSWRTVVFEHIERRGVEMGEFAFNTPVQYNEYGGPKDAVRLYQDGGRDTLAQDADQVFTLVSERITPHNRKAYEDFVRSSRHIILTTSDFLPLVTRRILIDRTSYTFFQRGESTRMQINFRFNQFLKTR